MGYYPEPVARLIDALQRLPGIGPRSAQRLTFFLLKRPIDEVRELSDALVGLKLSIVNCSRCFNVTQDDPCRICADPARDGRLLCIVEEPNDLLAMERTGDLILATNPNVEGEATAIYLSKLLKPLGARLTRIARGLPVGGDLEYADQVTLSKALEGRKEV